MEIQRQKNVATRIVFPIVDADGDMVTGATGLDSEIDQWADGANPTGFADCTNEATEIGSTGIYYLSLTQGEMNDDYIVIQIKTSSVGAKTQIILINTYPATTITSRASQTSVDTVDDFLDTEIAAIITKVDTVDDFLDTEIAAILAAVDTEVGAIKTKTDQLTFTAANHIDANIKKINGVAVDGAGTVGDPWGPV
jgi:hypothetical protein